MQDNSDSHNKIQLYFSAGFFQLGVERGATFVISCLLNAYLRKKNPIRVDPKVKWGKNEKNAKLLLLKECPFTLKLPPKFSTMIMGAFLEVESEN